MVEDLRFTRLGFWDQRFVQNVEDVLADLLEFSLDLLTILLDSRNMLVGTLGLFLLFDRGDDAPGSTSCANHVLVSNTEEVSLVD